MNIEDVRPCRVPYKELCPFIFDVRFAFLISAIFFSHFSYTCGVKRETNLMLKFSDERFKMFGDLFDPDEDPHYQTLPDPPWEITSSV